MLSSVAEYRIAAQRRLPRLAFDYLDGGAEDGDALQRNNDAYRQWLFKPRVLTDVSRCSSATQFFGRDAAAPMIVGPTGLNGLFWPRADELLAQAAGPRGLAVRVVDGIDFAAGRCARRRAAWRSLDAALRATGSRHRRRSDAARKRCGLFNTGSHRRCPRARQARSRHAQRFPLAVAAVAQAFRRLRDASALVLADDAVWFSAIEEHCEERRRACGFIAPCRDAEPADGPDTGLGGSGMGTTALERQSDRQRGLWVSTMRCWPSRTARTGLLYRIMAGGSWESTFAPLEVLLGIVEAVRGRMEIFIDGGVRRGSDALKRVALGARGVLLGRAPLYGVASRGGAGASEVLALMMDEMLISMHLLGCQGIADVSPAFVEHAGRAV